MGSAWAIGPEGYWEGQGAGKPVLAWLPGVDCKIECNFGITTDHSTGGGMSKTVPYEVEITQADIDNGCKSKASNCPGALAINRVVAPLGLYSAVGITFTDFYDEPVPFQGFDDYKEPVHTMGNPNILKMFVTAFDDSRLALPVKFTIELPEDLKVVRLTLTGREADTLAAILYNIGGHPAISPRKHVSSLRDKLQSAGVRGGGVDEARGLIGGKIMFSDYGKTVTFW